MYERLLAKIYDLIPERREASQYYTACVLQEAADAIEQLSMKLHGDEAAIAGMKREIERMVVTGASCWIPVTERLPEEYVGALCYCSRNGQYGCGEWCKEDNGTILWIGLNGMIPTHWMPLPEPPKEEKQ